MGLVAKEEINKYTYADYLSWDDRERWEIINGEAFNMSPAPSTIHQLISMELAFQLKARFKDQSCRVIPGPFDVRLPLGEEKEEDIENIVQPDISVICSGGKLDERGCLGAPDLVIEIISPSTYRKDRMEKFFLYEQVGVKEYWLVSPVDKIVEVFILGDDGKYGRPYIYCEKDTVPLRINKSIRIDLNPVFSVKV